MKIKADDFCLSALFLFLKEIWYVKIGLEINPFYSIMFS